MKIVTYIYDMFERRALTRIRCGSAPLAVELGRCKNGRYIPFEERICPVCSEGIEDEFHMLFSCSLYYDDMREECFQSVNRVFNDFTHLSDKDKFIFLMSSNEVTKYTTKACHRMMGRRSAYLRRS